MTTAKNVAVALRSVDLFLKAVKKHGISNAFDLASLRIQFPRPLTFRLSERRFQTFVMIGKEMSEMGLTGMQCVKRRMGGSNFVFLLKLYFFFMTYTTYLNPEKSGDEPCFSIRRGGDLQIKSSA